MLSGSCPRGSSSTPVSGKIGRMPGSAPEDRSSAASLMAPDASREHQRGEAAPRRHGQRVGRSHDLEELDELLARRLLVPGAVPAVEGQQLVDALFALAGAEERRREFEPRLMVVAVGGESGTELVGLAHRLHRLLGKLQRRVRGGDLDMAEVLQREAENI